MTAAPFVLGPDQAGQLLVADRGRVTHFGSGGPRRSGTRPCPRSTLAPGRINAHTHIYSGLAPLGMPKPEPKPRNFPEILETIWWRLDRALDPASLRASARLYAAEALVAGTTTLVDHHESPSFIEGSLDVLADACHQLGLRAVVTYGATERNGGRQEARRGLAECARFLRENDRPLVRGVVGLHASFTVSDDTVREAGELARELGTVIHIHLAEDTADVEDARRRGYAGPLERLLELDALPPGSILAHGVHLSAEQVRRTESAGLWLVQNPRSNRGNEVGYPRFLKESRRVALGTDGYPARMEEEVEALRQEAASHGDDPAAVGRRLEAAPGMLEERFGLCFDPRTPGAAADVVAWGAGGDARHVVVGGRPVVEEGRLLTADLAEIHAEAREQAQLLWERMSAL